MSSYTELLDEAYSTVEKNLEIPVIQDLTSLERVEIVARNAANRAGVRALLACALAKAVDNSLDIRKPYTEIGDEDDYSGRNIDEIYIAPFVAKHALPVNPTTAFLTPAFRNRNTVLLPSTNLSGRPKAVYDAFLQLLTNVHLGEVTARELLFETIRQLIIFRNEKSSRIASLLNDLTSSRGDIPLAAEQIVTIISQHLATRGASRLPVLIIAAAYRAVAGFLGEIPRALHAHNAADRQTLALGDVEITLADSDDVITAYEMKLRRVTTTDIDLAIHEKIARAPRRPDNYIFITTEFIEPDVQAYATSVYDRIGVEIVILDCIGFLRHYLHLFHRHRMAFLNVYQDLVVAEPESAVSQPVKEVLLTLRQAAEAANLKIDP